MYKLEYEDDLCHKFESFFVTKDLAYSWIRYNKNLREWTLFDKENRIVGYYKNPNAD